MAGDLGRESASPRQVQPWAQAHAGFLRAMLLIVAYCSAVIVLISAIAFRGFNAVSIVTGALCIFAIVAIFLLPRSRRK
jgi:uncharacterized membrane protein